MSVEEWGRGIAAVLTVTGLADYTRRSVRDAIARRKQRLTPEQQVREDIDGNILTVVRARDELAEDNTRLREEIRETNTRHAHDRAEWGRERAALRAEVEHLEARLRALLDELTALKSRHGI